MQDKIAIYPGTFDPITFGHIDIIKRAASMFDHLVIAIAADNRKNTLLPISKRLELIRHEVEAVDNCSVVAFEGLLVEFVKASNAKIIVRGIRAVSDFEYEFQMAYMNKKLSDLIETVFLPASEQSHFISSSFVKEIARLNGNLEGFISDYVAQTLKQYLCKKD